jgi:hypothetical protein
MQNISSSRCGVQLATPSGSGGTGTRINVGRDRYGGRLPWLALFLRRAFLLRVRFDTVTRSLLVLKFVDLRLVLSLPSRLTAAWLPTRRRRAALGVGAIGDRDLRRELADRTRGVPPRHNDLSPDHAGRVCCIERSEVILTGNFTA